MFNNRKMGSSDSLLNTIREIMEKKHTTPETPKEKSLAKLAHPKDKITHKDVLVGRGVLKKENSGERMGVIVGTRKEKVELEPKLKESEQFDENMSPEHKKLARDVHNQLKRDDSMSQGAGLTLKSNHKMLKAKYGSDWRKKADIKEEADGGKHSTYTIKTSGDQKNIHKEMMKHVNPGYHHWIGHHSKKGPISDDDHKEIKRVANANDANVHVSSSRDEEGYHHVLIHSSTRESAKSTADDLYDEGGSVTRHRPKKSTRNEDVQHVTERELTAAEKAKKEKYVMSLKGKMGGFKKRYGERAKEVMYATATKMAKEETQNVDEVSTGLANRYLSKTQGDDKRQAGRALALKKKWGSRVRGADAPKVPTKD